jgi:hypothetical protein
MQMTLLETFVDKITTFLALTLFLYVPLYALRALYRRWKNRDA